MENEKWRFPASGHGERKGISSGDIEAFKKTPIKSFAREILQNSIDARDSDEEPTQVEFKLFKIPTINIPGYSDLKEQLRRCIEFWAYKDDYVKEYKYIIQILEQKEIICLRVSDFNTTGLIGVESEIQKQNNFLALTKGTGVSEKNDLLAGGSKGVGKNAAFLMSSVNTVFYSTKANQDIQGNKGVFNGAIGVSELVSGYLKDDNKEQNRDYTQGTGYFSGNELNGAIKRLLEIDPSYKRGEKFGTDIYILGFKVEDGWVNEIINSLLDSFMTTIFRGELEVTVNNISVNKNTLESVIYDENIIYKSNRSNVISQYRLLNNKNDEVHAYDIDTEYGSCDLYILPFSKKEEELATHKCVMIRHPLMKIKEESLGASFRVSAMCIIGEGKLGETLRSIENPQHIDWETKRIKDKNIRKDVENVLKDIRKQIQEYVIDCLQLGDDNSLDPNGAGDFLPDVDIDDVDGNESSTEQKLSDKVSISKPKNNDIYEKNATIYNDNGNALQPDIGSIDESNDGDVSHPVGSNDVSGGMNHPGSELSEEKEGDNVIFKKNKLSGVRYKVLSTNKNDGQMKIIFIAPIDYDNCYLAINFLDDMNKPTKVKINTMSCNDVPVKSNDYYEYGPFSIIQNRKIVLSVAVDIKGYFGSEVKIICK